MTEPETFEDDLFADLYNDDDPAPKPSSAPDNAAAEQPSAAGDSYDPAQDLNQQYDDQTGQDSYMNQGDGADEEDDDDVDFNLGNGTSTAHREEHEEPSQGYGAPQQQQQQQQQHHGHGRGPNAKEDGKMFIGGLNWETTDQSLRDYFSQFGEVIECTVMRDGATGRSRGFGFLTFKDPKTVNIVMVKEHYLDGKIIDPKRAIPRDEQEKTSKIFVGGVSQETTDHEFREYFARFGRVVDATLMMDKDTGRPRGFGFVTFESDAGVEACLAANLEIHGKPIEVKKAQPRGNMREEEESAARRGQGAGGGKFGRKGDNRAGAAGGQGGGADDGSGQMGAGMGGAPGGMTPQVMAQYWQRMQQYFAMMQQQMAMNRGAMNMNPAMLQMMQMQQMQQMMAAQQGRGGAGANPMAAAMGQMNPAMMQQMQQMMQQQQQQPQGGGLAGGMSPGGQAAGSMSPVSQGNAGGGQQGGSNGGGAGGNRGGPGYNAFEQQQFEQQKYEQQLQQQQQQQRRPNYRDQQQGFGGGGGYGGPTSWEGMYDDVPQPMMNQGPMGGGGGGAGRGGFHKHRGGYHQQQQQQMMPQDPNAAPPPNAPTGPKNAGKPGANYRGGGRGGNRGFHPYSRV